jgi:methionyl-tRNA formyltransferase
MKEKTPIVLFAYNFPHKKTQDFIFRLLADGYEISVIYAADPIALNIPKSSIKSKINHIGLIHPSDIARNFGIRYVVTSHDSDLIKEEVTNSDSLAIISGARILKPHIIDLFTKGIINFHPGVIPYARGLDALFWSIYNDNPLGVTAHLIDKNIDAGKILCINKIKVYPTDTLLDLSERLYEEQLEMIAPSIEKAINNEGYLLTDYGHYNRKMEPTLEKQVLEITSQYVLNHSNG